MEVPKGEHDEKSKDEMPTATATSTSVSNGNVTNTSKPTETATVSGNRVIKYTIINPVKLIGSDGTGTQDPTPPQVQGNQPLLNLILPENEVVSAHQPDTQPHHKIVTINTMERVVVKGPHMGTRPQNPAITLGTTHIQLPTVLSAGNQPLLNLILPENAVVSAHQPDTQQQQKSVTINTMGRVVIKGPHMDTRQQNPTVSIGTKTPGQTPALLKKTEKGFQLLHVGTTSSGSGTQTICGTNSTNPTHIQLPTVPSASIGTTSSSNKIVVNTSVTSSDPHSYTTTEANGTLQQPQQQTTSIQQQQQMDQQNQHLLPQPQIAQIPITSGDQKTASSSKNTTTISSKISSGLGASSTTASIKTQIRERCRGFLANLICLAARESIEMEESMRKLVQELVDDKIESKEFCEGVRELTNAHLQPCFPGFLKQNMPLLRQALFTGEVVIEDIKPPPKNVVDSYTTQTNIKLEQPHQQTTGIQQPSSHMQRQQQTSSSSSESSVSSTTEKCRAFLEDLIRLSKRDCAENEKAMRNLVQELVNANIEPDEFCKGMEQSVKVISQRCLDEFLKRQMPLLRKALFSGEAVIEDIKPPPQHVANMMIDETEELLSSPSAVGSRTTAIKKATAKRSKKPRVVKARTPVPTNTVRPVGRPPKGKNTAPQKRRGKLGRAQIKRDLRTPTATSTFPIVSTILPTNNSGTTATANTDDSDMDEVMDEVFLHLPALRARIQGLVMKQGMEEPSKDVTLLISHACRERLRSIVEKLTAIAEHRAAEIKSDPDYEVAKDVRSQIKFLEEIEKGEQRRQERIKREILFLAAKSRSKIETAEQAKIKARVKEIQRAELEEMRQKDSNMTALDAIGPRKRIKLDVEGNTGSGGVQSAPLRQRHKRILMRDMLFYMEQDPATSRSEILYKAYLK